MGRWICTRQDEEAPFEPWWARRRLLMMWMGGRTNQFLVILARLLYTTPAAVIKYPCPLDRASCQYTTKLTTL